MTKNYQEENYKNNYIFNGKQKDKNKYLSYIDKIPEQYKRKEYIIDKLNCKKKNVE